MKNFYLIFLCCLFSLYAYEEVKIKDLYENGKKLNGKIVVIEGEAIGDIMGKGEERWLNIKDEKENFAIGVVIDQKDLYKIENLGKYRVRGDILKIEGIYNINCVKHQGERDIHAIKVEIIKKGEKLPPAEISLKKIILTFILLAINIFLINLYHK